MDSGGGIVAVGAFGQLSWDSDTSASPKFTTFGDVILSAAGSGDAVVWKLNQQGRAVQVDSIKTHVDSAYGISA
jgi:hypothetical protein